MWSVECCPLYRYTVMTPSLPTVRRSECAPFSVLCGAVGLSNQLFAKTEPTLKTVNNPVGCPYAAPLAASAHHWSGGAPPGPLWGPDSLVARSRTRGGPRGAGARLPRAKGMAKG